MVWLQLLDSLDFEVEVAPEELEELSELVLEDLLSAGILAFVELDSEELLPLEA